MNKINISLSGRVGRNECAKILIKADCVAIKLNMENLNLQEKYNELSKLQGSEINIKNATSLDRYGFSYLLAAKLNLKHPIRPFCSWVHGWNFWDDMFKVEDIIGMNRSSLNSSIIVNSILESIKLNEVGYTNVNVGGLPFAYVEEQGINRNSNVMLAFIGHSSESERMDVLDINYLNFLESQRNKFETIYISIYSLDRNTNLIEGIVKRGLVPINGANPFDRRSLIRTRIALEYCEHVSTNTFGSHIAYSLAVGCRLSVFSPCYKHDTTKFLNTDHNYSADYIERIEYCTSESYLRKRWSYLFDRCPEDGYCNKELGLEWIGEINKINNKKLKRVLGWNMDGQIKGYLSGGIRRLNRLFN